MNMNKNDTFRDRVIEETFGQHMQDNWGKYAAGAGAGAVGMAASHILGDGGLDDAREAYNTDGFRGVKDHLLDKMQSGMDTIKSDNSDSSTASRNEDWKPNNNQLKNLVGDKSDGNFSIDDASSGKEMNNLDKINSMAFKHRDVDAGGYMPWQGSRPEYSTNMFGQADPNVTKDDIEKYELEQIQNTTKDAMSDGRIDAGEAKNIQDMYNDRTSERWFTQSDAADNLEAQRAQETQLGLDTAEKYGHDVLISGDYEAREQFFNDIKQKMGGIPKEYMGLYKDHIRQMAQR